MPSSGAAGVGMVSPTILQSFNCASTTRPPLGARSRPDDPPASSDTVLVTQTSYDDAGNAYRTVDPAGTVSTRSFDDLGRVTSTIQNDVQSPSGPDQDVTVAMQYNSDGNLTKLTALNSTTGNQETKYVYGTNLGGITPAVYRNDLLRAVIYPDSDDTTALANGGDGVYDRVEYRYSRQGERIQLKDQNQTVHDYDLDKLGRLLADKVTLAQGSAIDDAVLRIERTYEVRGMLYELSSYDAASSGNVVNQVVREYNDLGLLCKEYQEHDGQKDGSTLYVQYDYDETASSGVLTKGMRPTKVTYPNGRLLHFVYDSGADDNLGRITSLADDNSGSPGTDLAEYTYLGLGTVVKVDYTEADLLCNLAHGTSEAYDGLDRFGRVVDLLWRDYGSSADAVRIKHGYDRAGNRLWREDPVAAANSVDQDEFYSYDGVYQLTEFQRGNLTGSPPTGVSSMSYYEDWTLDPTGNWTEFFQDDNDDHEIWVLDQDRGHNKANEVSSIMTQTGGEWATPAHDAAGNMTTMPQPSQPFDGFACTYDAWNRLVKVTHSNYPQYVYGQYQYDGQHRRLTETASGSTRHFYHSDRWQVLEERIGSSSTADCQYVWGQRYIDDLVLRDRDSDSDAQTGSLGKSGSGLDERLYAMQDPNFNVVAIAESDGDVAQRYRYDAYGKHTKLGPSFGAPGTNYAWPYLYTTRHLDSATGLMYYCNRYYHTGQGRFMTRDPDGYASGVNEYEYVHNMPLGNADPTGLLVWQTYTCPGLTRCMKVTSYSGIWRETGWVNCSDADQMVMWGTLTAASLPLRQPLATIIAGAIAGTYCKCEMKGRYKTYTAKEWFGEYQVGWSLFQGYVYNYRFDHWGPNEDFVYAFQFNLRWKLASNNGCCRQDAPWIYLENGWRDVPLTTTEEDVIESAEWWSWPDWAPGEWTGWIDPY